ncbi:unnamed protein product [Rhizophagus irregularis]|nr:unnamed protein product [Rhizophagus irregularis]
MGKKCEKNTSHFPSFQTTTNLLSSSNNPINNSNNIDNIQDAAQIKASYYREKAKVKNTEKSTKSWSTKFEEFRSCAGYSVPLTDLKDISQLQKQIVEFISTMKMKNGGQAHIISIPADNNGPCSDIQLYLSKRPPSGDENFYLQPNNTSWLETNIWYKKDHVGKNKLGNFMKKIGRETQIDIPIELLSNHSGRKTATQILQDQEVPEQAIMQLTGHKSVQGVRAYKKVNENQQLNTLNTLINITDNKSSTFIQENSQNNLINNDNSNSQLPLQEISLSLDSLNESPIFHNCTFSNVTFNIQK